MSESPVRAIERRLAAGETILIDGATGTELERRGAQMHKIAWCATATLTSPDLLRSVHADYIRAGASIVIANTYATNRIMLEPAGLADDFETLNRRAVEIAREARDAVAGGDAVAVAGSMSHMMPMRRGTSDYDPERAPGPERLRECFAEMAGALAAAGVDLVVMEMMSDPDLAAPAIEAALATGLPVWVGYTGWREDDRRIAAYRRPEMDFAEMVRRVHPDAAPVAGVMHTHVEDTGDALAALRGVFDGPTMAYPDSGHASMPHWHFEEVITPRAFADAALRWHDAGTRILGGCCGLGVAHIEALAEALAKR